MAGALLVKDRIGAAGVERERFAQVILRALLNTRDVGPGGQRVKPR